MVNVLSIVNILQSSSVELRGVGRVAIFPKSIEVGNSAVVARCYVEGSCCDKLIKCYYRRVDSSTCGGSTSFYPKALMVSTLRGSVEYVDVELYDWAQGTPLDVLMTDVCYPVAMLSKMFDRMAIDHLRNGARHGDIRPENIIVADWGGVVLIDGADMAKPSRSPLSCSDGTTDDFMLAFISVLLATIAVDANFFSRECARDRMWFSYSELMANHIRYIKYAQMVLFRAGDVDHYRLACVLGMVNPRFSALLRDVLSSMPYPDL